MVIKIQEYPNLMRLRFDHISVRSEKRYIPAQDEESFFSSNNLYVTEKVDGSQCAVGWKGGKPYAQGRSGHISEFDKRVAFDGLWSWIWQNCEKLEKSKGYLIFGEWMKPMHSIFYDELPEFFIAFDLFDNKNKKFVDWKKASEMLIDWGFFVTPTLYFGKVKKSDVPNYVDNKKSVFSTIENCEGCVIKDYQQQKFLKYVTREFMEEMFDDSGHWTGRKTVRYNRLKGW